MKNRKLGKFWARSDNRAKVSAAVRVVSLIAVIWLGWELGDYVEGAFVPFSILTVAAAAAVSID